MKLKLVLLTLAAVCLVAPTYGQTPDQETPANEGVCDDLMYATPGLYGLCIAFCEAQDCEPDFSLDDPLENCKPSSEKLLRNYDRKKQPSDPDMPCIQQTACPCWTQEELDGLRYPVPGETEARGRCSDDEYHTNWRVCESTGPCSKSNWATVYVNGPENAECTLIDRCIFDPSSCLNVVRSLSITDEEFIACQAQVRQSGADRGYPCFN